MSICISVQGVSKSFRKKQCVLQSVTVNFESGKIHGIIGKNGSGKTVLLKIISGLMKASSGIVLVNNRRIGIDVDFPDDIGLIIEAPGFLPYHSGFSNLMYLASLKNKIGREEVEKAMIRVGLEPKSKKWVSQYSLGMKQRLGLAQAIMEDPSVLILDEPMNGLDKAGIAEMHKLFCEFREMGKTLLLVSHSSDDIQGLCDTVCEIDRGVLSKIYGFEDEIT